MINAIVVFVLLTISVGFAIDIFRSLTGKEKWKLFKTFMYGGACAAIALLLLFGFVIVF